MKVLSLSQSCR